MKKSKTEKKIQDALLLLLKTESINHITMSQIAQKANLNRVTLYRHYNDKWDILENIEQEFLHKLDTPHAKMITNLQLTTQSLHPHPNLRALTSFFKVFQDNFPLLQVLMGPNANLGFTNKLMTYLINLEEKSHPYIPVNIQKLNPDMFSYYSISSLIGIIQFWRKNQNYSPSQMAEFFFKIRIGAIKEFQNK